MCMGVEFEQENDFNRSFRVQQESSGGFSIINFLIKRGWVKDENQANKALVVIIVFVIIVTAFIFYKFVFGGSILPEKASPNAKIIQGYRDQGLTGQALFERMMEDRKSGLIK